VRVGIYSGSFDPIHSGHIGFALQAVHAANLDRVVFLPERHPRGKTGVTHYAHRLAMLRRALKAHKRLEILELPDRRFYPRTIARLNAIYPQDNLLLLLGSDTVYSLGKWPQVGILLKRCGLIIALRESDQPLTISEKLGNLPIQPPEKCLLASPAPYISSREIRDALDANRAAPGLLSSVKAYSDEHWLYKQV
jgi:nicotinate-nucleotide adenylyltransferase